MRTSNEVVENITPMNYRPRKTVKIFLELSDPDDVMLIELFLQWKKKRKFSPNIKLASKLFDELDRGSTALLYETFPWLVNNFGSPQDDLSNSELYSKLRDILNSATPQLVAPERPLSLAAPPQREALSNQHSDAAVGELLEVQTAKTSTIEGQTWNVPYCNLQLGLYQLGSIKNLSDLDDEVLEFGVHIGKIPAAQARKVLEARRREKPPQAPDEAILVTTDRSNARPLAGAEKPLTAPTFTDDLDDLL